MVSQHEPRTWRWFVVVCIGAAALSGCGDSNVMVVVPRPAAPLGFRPAAFFPAHQHTTPAAASDEQWAFYQQGGGLALGDVDSDGLDDMFVSGGASGHRLFLRRSDGGFEESVGSLPPIEGFVSSATFADVDGDGDVDLLLSHLLHVGGLTLLRNDGATFVDVTLASGLWDFTPRAAWSTSFADVDGDGDLDFFVAQWLHWTTTNATPRPHMFCNDGAGHFEDCSSSAGLVAPFAEHTDSSFTATFADLDEDGVRDLLLASDYRRSHVFRGDGEGAFVSLPTSALLSIEFGMGSVVADFDGDRHLDWFVTAISFEFQNINSNGNRLMLGDGAGRLRDVSEASGTTEGGWGWAACAADFDLDGDVDLFHVNGYDERPAVELSDFARMDRSRLFLNDGAAHFTDVAAAVGVDDSSHLTATVCADFDGDGDIDIATLAVGGELRAYENTLGGGLHYVALDLEGRGANTHAIGAWVEVRSGDSTQVRERRIDNTHTSGQSTRLHLGLPTGALVDALVRWPDGSRTEHRRLAPNVRHRLQQP